MTGENEPVLSNEDKKVRRWLPRFSLAGLFLVVTIVCVRMAVESHRYRTRRLVEIRVEVDLEPLVQKQLLDELREIDGVSIVISGDRFIRVRMRTDAKQDVLDVLDRYDISAENVQDIF